METIQNFVRSFFRNRNSSCNSNTTDEAYIRIKKRIRRSRLKESVELYTEIFLLMLAIMLLGISIYFFLVYVHGVY